MTVSKESSSASVPTTGDRERIVLSIENWKRKLLDLSKRNRALNFRMNKVSTVAIIDEQPAEVFRQLYLREQGMRFKAAPVVDQQHSQNNVASLARERDEAVTRGAGAADELSLAAIEEDDEAPEVDFAPYDPASLDERHTDDCLQTASKPEMLDKSLRRLDEEARLAIEEQGVNTLFLALGMLHYKKSPDSEQIFKAPQTGSKTATARSSD